METCRMCGAQLTDKEEMQHHNELMHPNMGAAKKGGEAAKQERAEHEASESKPLT